MSNLLFHILARKLARILFVVAFVALFHVLRALTTDNRPRRWKRLSAQLGLPYFNRNNNFAAPLQHFRVFQRGISQWLQEGLVGKAQDRQLIVGDLQVIEQAGRRLATVTQTVCIVTVEWLDLPDCWIYPVISVDPCNRKAGLQQFTFAADPAFDAVCYVEGSDEAAVRELLDDRMRAWLVKHSHRKFTIEAKGRSFLIHRNGKLGSGGIREILDYGLELLESLANDRPKAVAAEERATQEMAIA